jgi:Zn-dependent M28 family amino/carboxypeptidase
MYASCRVFFETIVVMIRVLPVVACITLLISGCSEDKPIVDSTGPETALDGTRMAQHIRVLASDEFEGRGLASPGEQKTIDYIVSQLREFGLQPGFGDSYVQDVPLIRIQTQPDAEISVDARSEHMVLHFGRDMVVWTKRADETIGIADSELVFVGYGVVAPEYGWNDYAGLDVTDKTVLILINDPGFATGDPDLFNGRAMTYYGRWTYKMEEAARQGASAALIVHQTEPAAYGWDVVMSSWSGPQYALDHKGETADRVAVEGWVTQEAAERILEATGENLVDLSEQALQQGFQAVALGADVNVTLSHSADKMVSRNVGAMIRGATRPEESIIFSAHWDHLGIDRNLADDPIYNGAKDNATGVAALIELARVSATLSQPLDRSLFFVSFTAEEAVLLGSRYFSENSPLPIDRMVAVLNIDMMNVWGQTRDVQVRGHGRSQLEDYLASAAQSQGRILVADPFPEKGYYYRSDHFSLARFGVPGLHVSSGTDFNDHGHQWGRAKDSDYLTYRYHKPADEFDPTWDLSGAVQDAELYLQVALRLANERRFPEWLDGNEFKAVRDKTAAARMR